MGRTVVAIEGDRFLVDGALTYPGTRVEGRLMNSRMVQATFDDLNPETRSRWDGPDGVWDAEANTDRFIAMLDTYRDHGLLAVTVNLQGGSPEGYSENQPWENNAFATDGALRPAFAARMARVLDACDARGMVVILGLFYFGQDERLDDEAAVVRATDGVTDWLLERGDRHVLVEIANEADLDFRYGAERAAEGRPKTWYEHEVLRVERGDELIRRVQERSAGRVDSPAGRLLVSTSQCGGSVLHPQIAGVADFVLLHGNDTSGPDEIRAMIAASRKVDGYRGQPIVINEDDHFDFAAPDNHLVAAVESGVSWGYFDYRMAGEGHAEGYQSVPTDWGISTVRKRGFFAALRGLTDGGTR